MARAFETKNGWMKWLARFAVVLLLGACVNDLDSVRKVTLLPTDPDERSKNLQIVYTDSGFAKVQVFATLAETYSKPEPVVKLKNGLKVHFFDDQGQILSTLTAKSGTIFQEKGQIIVRDSVELFNAEKKQKLETEELRWTRKDSTIFTEKSVIVRAPGSILFGKGIRTKQDFSTYEFLQPTGTIDLSKAKKQ